MKNQVGSSRLDTVLKMLLIAFISLLAFSSGVYFGKQMSDSDYQLKALEADFNSATKTAQNTEHMDIKQDEAILEDEIDAIAEKFVEVERQPASAEHGGDGHTAAPDAKKHDEKAHGQANHEVGHETNHDKTPSTKTTAKPAPETTKTEATAHHGEKSDVANPDVSAVHKAASRVAHNQAPTEDSKKPVTETSRVPSNLPKTVGASRDVEFTVQVASYPNAADAKSHASELVKKGFPAFPVEATIEGKTWYRVSVGSFKTSKEADKYRAQLIKDGGVQAALVQKIQR